MDAKNLENVICQFVQLLVDVFCFFFNLLLLEIVAKQLQLQCLMHPIISDKVGATMWNGNAAAGQHNATKLKYNLFLARISVSCCACTTSPSLCSELSYPFIFLSKCCEEHFKLAQTAECCKLCTPNGHWCPLRARAASSRWHAL